MPPKKSLKFVLPEDEKRKSSTEYKAFRNSIHPSHSDDESQPKSNKTFRKSKYPVLNEDELERKSRISNIVSSRARYSTRLTQMFTNMKVMRDRQSSVLRPVEIYLPTYRMESKKPFDPRIVEDYLKSRIKERLDDETFEFDDSKSMHTLARHLSEDILSEVKGFQFDRYKIFVSVTLGQKLHQGFNKSVGVLWDVETDSMATFIYERNNIFAIFNVFGIYFD
ncbi:dynein light chain Tctex-type 5-like [Chironomus tepperi]|uniref:dynein light chain Tctex-type 5-like n=1 Tax=Chironomus tepperi TaxID=113505 RepID=UPI00391F6C56